MTKRIRGISKCPPEIQVEIDAANSLPSGFPPKNTYSFELVHEINFFYELVKSAVLLDEKRKREQEMFKKIVTELPFEFIASNKWITEILGGKTVTLDASLQNSKDKIYKQAFDYFQEDYEEGRWIELISQPDKSLTYISPLAHLQSQIRQTKAKRKNFLKIVEWNKQVRDKKHKEIFPKHQLLCFTLDEGVLDVRILAPVFQKLKDTKVDTRRIGQCQTCHIFFWRQRENASACSRKCANKYHQKSFQSDEQKRAALNEKRRENYQRKKKVEEIKKKNGTL
ncbi:MAG TPA: hypothetical protein VK308_03615 [Pyrinomonadaceae bacterium]|nr:hypothetical protein [Pyrinomonadaceae bacterium]